MRPRATANVLQHAGTGPGSADEESMAYTMNVVGTDGRVKRFVHKDILPEKIEEDKAYVDILGRIGGYTMTIGNGASATYNLFKSVKYVAQNNIEGDIVECGVWKGGSMMLIAGALQYFNDRSRDLYLYDTFSGMTEPDEIDIDYDGTKLKEIWQSASRRGGNIGCGDSAEKVKANLRLTNYPVNRMHIVKGDVLETIPKTVPEKIALVRLDTDFYKSTLHELTHLYPLVVSGGVVFIDDYGWCNGARQATDEFLQTLDFNPLLVRIDECVRIIIKP
jgi:O-methyltransferase